MTSNTSEVDIKIVLRHVEPPESARQYALDKLGGVIHSVPTLRYAAIEVTYEGAAAPEHRYLMNVNVEPSGDILRVEERGPTVEAVTDATYDVLERRIRDWKGEVYFEPRKEGAEAKESQLTEATKLPPDDKSGWIISKESQEIKPMFVEDAVQQLEELALDFLFFLNAENNQYNVVYRRKDNGYGWIVPSYPDVDTSDLPQP